MIEIKTPYSWNTGEEVASGKGGLRYGMTSV